MEPQDKLHILEPLLQGLTHEIRNPVQGILASSDALRCRHEDDVTDSKLIDMIQRECIRIDQLLTDLLDLARPVTIDRTKSQSFNALLEESLRAFNQQNVGIQLSADIASLPNVYMDQHSIRRALLAVLQNASESKPAGVSIRVAAVHSGSHVIVRIEDNGSGILPEDLAKVLEPFFSTRPQKAGLGLSIAERIIRLHAGQLKIQSQNREGSVVIIELPVS